MAEVLGAASAASGLLEIAIRIFGRLRKAYERSKDLVGVIDAHTLELNNIKSMIQTVEDEDDLQTAPVGVELAKLKAVEDKVVIYLKEIDPGTKGSVHRLAHQLIHGSEEEKKLAKLMNILSQAKFDLFFRIQVATVGVIREVGDVVIANAEIIKRIDGCLVELFGEGKGLKIAKLLKDGSPQGEGMVSLKKADVEALDGEENTDDSEASPGSSVGGKIRRILRNTTKNQAIMIAGPIGEDIWKDMYCVEIRDNVALDQSAMVAYPTDFETVKYFLDRQERIMDK